ncbi:TonB family protein [Bosea sp. F3-2]|uniref:energy transducer TonB family protein n=1 Tax=Bosea sp. F3-2 TaxID=2599640 RepID=UPI0011EDCB54|nr:energy transducer TonB [Bosea sp. F3-2]QEL21786.1 TonB family protein [Bosea sp. F3-2]
MSVERRSLSRFAPAALRWSVAALVVASAHGAAGWVVANWQRAEAAMGSPPAAVMIELAPLAVAPEAPQQDVAPGPDMVEAQPEPEPPTPEPVEQPKEPEPPRPEPVAIPEPEIKIPELPPLPDAAAVLTPPPEEQPKPPEVKPKPKPKPKVVERRKPLNPDKPKADQTTAPMAQAQNAPQAAAPASGASSASPAANASWRGSLIAHLNRFKRFPGGASPGTVQVAFSIDRGGRVLSARLVRGSGDAALDEEAVAMIRRASPVPAPPDGIGGNSIALAVPVRFSR